MTYETTLIFSFEHQQALTHEFKFNIRGENFDDIRKKAKALQNEIFMSVYGGESTTIHPIRFEFGDEILKT